MQPTALRHPIGHPGILVAATVLIFGLALAADAKVPPFEMEVETDATRAIVTLTIGQEDLDPPNLTGLVAIYPGSDLDHEGRPTDQTAGVVVPLTRIAAGTYQGTVRLEPGHWAAVPFPNVMNVSASDLDPYPQAVHFELRTGSALSLATGGLAVAALVALWVVVIRLRAPWRPTLAATLALEPSGSPQPPAPTKEELRSSVP